MAKTDSSCSEMAHARQNDGINVIFDHKSPPANNRSRSRCSSPSSRSSSGSSRTSDRHRGHGTNRRRYRSSSSSLSKSSSRSGSTSRSRSRSHPRCHRQTSRCCCDRHYRYSRGHSRSSRPRCYRAHSRSYRSSPLDRYSYRHSDSRRYRSRSRSPYRISSYRRGMNHYSTSPSRTYREQSRSPDTSVGLNMDDKRELLKVAKENAEKILGVTTFELPESVKPLLSNKCERGSPTLERRRIRESEETSSQNEEEPGNVSSPRLSPKRRIISFSMNNSVAKPIVASPSRAKVTPRVDSYESRKPYGHWIPVKSGQTSAHKKCNLLH